MNSRLAPGLVWPVRADALRLALGDAWDSAEVSWLFGTKQPSERLLEETWGPEGAFRRGLGVTIHPMAKEDPATVQQIVVVEVLPDLARRCRSASTAPEGWQLMRHNRRWTVVDGAVLADERSGVDPLPRQW